MSKSFFVLIIVMALCLPFTYGGCGGSSGGGNGDDGDSADGHNVGSNPDGPKIFVTAARHVGDFANDPTLTGSNGIEKADDFCMQDENLPRDDSIYKALLIDGINRDAATLVDWVLQPNTTYYRPNGVKIDTTNGDAIFTAFWRDMNNSIGPDFGDDLGVWTGILDAGDFSTNTDYHCSGWSSSLGSAGFARSANKDGIAFSWPGGKASCSLIEKLYCVEQAEGSRDGNDDGNNIGSNPEGLKIFVTAATHVGDFANDPTLSGLTGIEKADDFCMQDANLPADGSIYKALLVDGINRDAVTLTDWVLQPNTTYYRPSGVEIDTTGNDAILPAYWREMENSIAKYTKDPESAWTGIRNASDFRTSGNCSGWSSSGTDTAGFGNSIAKGRSAFDWYGGGSACWIPHTLYCVEQP